MTSLYVNLTNILTNKLPAIAELHQRISVSRERFEYTEIPDNYHQMSTRVIQLAGSSKSHRIIMIWPPFFGLVATSGEEERNWVKERIQRRGLS